MAFLPPAARIAIASLIIAAGVFFGVAGFLRLRESDALETRGARTTAVLAGESARESDSDTGHQVRYRFVLGGVGYGPTGIFGSDVSVDIGVAELDHARATGAVDVTYLPDRPSVNALTSRLGERRSKSLSAIVAGVAMMVVGAGGILFALAARRRALAV